MQAVLNEGLPARTAKLDAEELVILRQFFLLTMKPTMYVANVAEGGFHDNPLLAKVEAHAKAEGAPVVAVCAAIEAEIADLDGDDRQAFLTDLGLSDPGEVGMVEMLADLVHFHASVTRSEEHSLNSSHGGISRMPSSA